MEMGAENKQEQENKNVNNEEMINAIEDANASSETEMKNMDANSEAEDQGQTTEVLAAQLEEANDRYVRLYAEFDNYKRRTSKERIELIQTAGKEVIGNLLTVVDDFDRALKMMESATDVSAVSEGVQLINQKFKKILQQQGLKEMNAMGETFDADYHEAITNIPAPSEDMKGKVIDEVEKGYFLHDKVLRYAKVVVGN
jgi:molecular chaperone GrpE